MINPLRRLPHLGAVACIAALAGGCNRAPGSGQNPESAADAFFATLEKGDAQGAYQSAAFGFQAAQTYEAFLSNARDLGLIGGQPPAWTQKQVHGSEADFEGSLVSQSGAPVDISVTLTPDGTVWKLFSLRTSTGQQDAGPEDRFTLVGKGTGFNDVYHQPIPNPAELDALVRATLTLFNSAIRSGDFHHFYSLISQQWKDGQRMTGEAAAGVTEKMLKDHFQGFTNMKIDLSPVVGLPLVYDRPPLINQDGLLDLQGHIDGPQFRMHFYLDYAYELPRWRLFGINVSLTK